MHVLDVVAFTMFVCVIVALPFSLFHWFRYLAKRWKARSSHPSVQNAPFPIKSVVAFVGSIALAGAAAQVSRQTAQGDVLSELQAMPSDCHVSIAGRPADNAPKVVQMLGQLRWGIAHHSSPSHPIFVHLTAPGRELVLNLSRDSSNAHEYWVFLPRYRVTSTNDIGRIFTDSLDRY